MIDRGSMLDQVARALHAELSLYLAEANASADVETRAARAAIAAMRQPTQEMMAAAYAAVGRDPNVMDAWQAMIGAALGE